MIWGLTEKVSGALSLHLSGLILWKFEIYAFRPSVLSAQSVSLSAIFFGKERRL
jgi:hypothetical protein